MKRHTVIPAVRNFKELEKALQAPSEWLFLLEGELIHLRNIVEMARRARKKIFMHLELIDGVKEDEASIHYLARELQIDGILSTRTSSLRYAKKYGLITVQRGFMLDSHSMRTIINTAAQGNSDYLELLPSFAYSKIQEIKAAVDIEIIFGGFIETENDLSKLFAAGVNMVSTSKPSLWQYNYICST
jgi:glycerol uptake operon antiterminator